MTRTRTIQRQFIACHPCASILLLFVLMWTAVDLRAQESAGQAEVALQGYYLGGNGQPFTETSGMAENLSEFIEGLGILRIDVEGYGGDGFKTGNMMAGLEGTPLLGWHWDFLGGDFHFSPELAENPFTNVYTPEIAGRGVNIVMRRTNRAYRVFMGEDTVLEGPRIPYRQILPQRVIGGTVEQTISSRWTVGARYLNLVTSAHALTDYPAYFSPGHMIHESNSLTFLSAYKVSDNFRLYGETGYAAVSSFVPPPVGQKPFSFLAGPTWKTGKFSVLANYVLQSTSYMPLLGYFAGDRKGPYGEAYYRPMGSLDLYGSASAYSNNLEKNPLVASFNSVGYSSGASVTLPWKFSVGGSLTTLRLRDAEPGPAPATISNNSQLNVNVSRQLGSQHLRFSLIDMKLDLSSQPQAQRFEELEDSFSWKHMLLEGAGRLQSAKSQGESRNTIFYRGAVQANFTRISFYANLEKGNDLINKSIFSTNSVSSEILGLGVPLFKGWKFQGEAYESRLLTALNPENIFLFGNSDQGLNTELANTNQKSIFFRISKSYSWGKPLGQGSTMEQYAAVHAPLVGTVEGIVTENSPGGAQPAANVAVILDHGRTVISDSSGQYVFTDVPEGTHDVELDMEELPADYAPGPDSRASVSVAPRVIAKTDFDVVRLTNISGTVIAPKDADLDNVVIRLAGSKTYTTPYSDGSFAFYNLPEGECEIEIDPETIPDGYMLSSPGRVTVTAGGSGASTRVEFKLVPKPKVEKPVKQILRQEIHVEGAGNANPQ